MNQRLTNAGRAFSTSSLVVAFGVSLGLALVAMTVIVVELGRIQQETMALADEGQHATYFVGDIGEQLARLRALVALGRQETPEEFGRHAGVLAQIESDLQEDMEGLGPTGHAPLGQVRWEGLQRDVERLRGIYSEAASLIRAGKVSQVAEVLVPEADLATRVYEALDEVARTHRRLMLHGLQSAQQRASGARMFALVTGGFFTLTMLATWALAIKRLRRQGQRLVEANVRLESANADLDAFAGRVAHDLKNALMPVVMAPTLLRLSSGDATRVQEIADRTERCSHRAVSVIDALLAFSRAARHDEAGEAGAVRSAVHNVLDGLAPQGAQLGVTVDVDELPDLYVRCSPGLLETVLANLCGNAFKYLDGQPERRVHISALREDSWCRIEIEDTGPGIPKEAQERIFEPFYRVHGTRAPGSGIGLATVRRIVDARGGRVAVESTEGRGSRFSVWLPLAPSPAEQARP